MGSFSRSVRRNKAKKAKKAMAEKVALFDKLGTECLTCQKPFDKTNKEQVLSWSVVVRNKENKVNLYCPECWNNATQVIEDFTKRNEENK